MGPLSALLPVQFDSVPAGFECSRGLEKVEGLPEEGTGVPSDSIGWLASTRWRKISALCLPPSPPQLLPSPVRSAALPRERQLTCLPTLQLQALQNVHRQVSSSAIAIASLFPHSTDLLLPV